MINQFPLIFILSPLSTLGFTLTLALKLRIGIYLFIAFHIDANLADGVYELVPAAEEIAQESEVNVVHVDPNPAQEYHFEQEGKHRSIT